MNRSRALRARSVAPAPNPRAKPLGSARVARAHAAHLIQELAALFPPEEWALVSEVLSEVGVLGARRADGLALRYRTTAEQVEVHGFEVKTSAADFQREVKDLGKSAPFRSVCVSWWIVVPAPWKNVVTSKFDLLTPWGLIEVGTGRPRRVVEAYTERNTEPLSPRLVLSLLRSALSQGTREEATLGAPARRIVRRIDRFTAGLSCNHVAQIPLAKLRDLPEELLCWSCAQGLPPDDKVIEEMILESSPERRARLAALATAGSEQSWIEPPGFSWMEAVRQGVEGMGIQRAGEGSAA